MKKQVLRLRFASLRMTFYELCLLHLATLTVAGALAAVLLKNTVHCALALTVAFAGLALLFLNLDAQFAGFAQILVYIGAVAILVVFAILLTQGSETPTDGVFSRTWFAGLAVAAAVFAVLGWAVIQSVHALPHETAAPDGHRAADRQGAGGSLRVAAGDCGAAADGRDDRRGDRCHARERGRASDAARVDIFWLPLCCLPSDWPAR